ncbi:MAG: radical SAM protein [Pirellulaceae bacterium]
MDTLNFIDLDFLEHQDEYYLRQFSGYLPLRGHWLCIGRGCTHSCPFCGGCYAAHKELARRKGFVLRSPERVVRDLQRLCRKGIDQGAFNLDIASLGNSYWAPLFHGMCEREVKIGIYNEFWGIPGKNFIEQMLRSVEISASRVAFSPLSGDETVRSLNGKDFKNEELLEILSLLQQRDMQVVIYFSLNLPGEDEETFENTLELAQKIYENYPSELLDILNMCHTLDPLSPMSTDPDRYGVQVNMTTFKDYYQYCYRTRRTGEDARSGKRRGFHLKERKRRSLKKMADSWDRAGQGRAPAWRPIPHTW